MKKTKILAGALSLYLLGTTTAMAANLMTYEGWGIRGKYSVSSFSNTGTFYVDHTNVAWNNVPSASQKMEVQAHLSTWYGYSNQQSITTTGTSTTTLTYSDLPTGTYKLYFYAPIDPAAADIKGTVRN